MDLTSLLQRATSSSTVDIVDMSSNRAGVPGKRAVRREKQRQQTGVIKRGRVFG